jgi:hypothetical protein
MTKLYVVMGENGEYSDREEWLVAAYLDEAKAKAHVMRAETALREFNSLSLDARFDLMRDNPGGGYLTPLDRVHGLSMADSHRYWLDTVELLDEVPT